MMHLDHEESKRVDESENIDDEVSPNDVSDHEETDESHKLEIRHFP